MPYARDQRHARDKRPTRLETLNRILSVLSVVAALASLLGISVLGILSRISRKVTDPWEIATGVVVALLVPSVVLAVRGFIYHRAVQAELVEEIRGRSALVDQERRFIKEASNSIGYIAGDFSHVADIESQLIAATNRNVTIRILGADSIVPAVRANFARAIALNCQIRLYDPNYRRVKAVIVDSDSTNSDGAVMFVRKSRKASHHESGQGSPGNDEAFEYVGTVYSDPLLITAVGQLFESLWEKSRPFS